MFSSSPPERCSLLDIPGKDNDNVYMANDVLVGNQILANSALVIGGENGWC